MTKHLQRSHENKLPLMYMPLALLFLELLGSLELLVMAPLVALKRLPDCSHTESRVCSIRVK